jgi:hypothetical protein
MPWHIVMQDTQRSPRHACTSTASAGAESIERLSAVFVLLLAMKETAASMSVMQWNRFPVSGVTCIQVLFKLGSQHLHQIATYLTG